MKNGIFITIFSIINTPIDLATEDNEVICEDQKNNLNDEEE